MNIENDMAELEDSIHKTLKNNSDDLKMYVELFKMQQVLKKHKENLFKVKNSDVFYLHMAVRVADIILEKMLCNFNKNSKIKFSTELGKMASINVKLSLPLDKKFKTYDKHTKSFYKVYHELLHRIRGILEIMDKLDNTKKRKYKVTNMVIDLINIAYEEKIIKSTSFMPSDNEADALHQHKLILESLERVS